MSQLAIPKEMHGPPLSEYEELEKLGIGSFGIVSLYKLKKKPWYVLRQIRSRTPDKMSVKRIMLVDNFGEHISRELFITLKIRHENVITFLGATSDRHFLYIKMELANCDLSKLKEKMKLGRYLPSDALLFASQILSGLCYLHDNSISHRDLKPQNILACWNEIYDAAPLTSLVTLKLSDFGLSRFVPDESVTATAVGTRSYMAPEIAQAFYRQTNYHGDFKKADVFSAGVIIYEMLNGKKPFSEIELIGDEEKKIAEEGAEYIQEELTKCVREMLRWKSTDRCDGKSARNQLLQRKVIPKRREGIANDKIYVQTAFEKDHSKEVEQLISSGSWHVDTADKYGVTKLHTACESGHISVALLLIKNGADVNKADFKGRTPLHYACFGGHLSAVKLLINNGADVNRVNKDGWAPLHTACREDHLAVVKLLIGHGADVRKANLYGKTPLHFASMHGHIPVVKMLIESGADVNATDEDGWTPLYCARYFRRDSVVALLLENGADKRRGNNHLLLA